MKIVFLGVDGVLNCPDSIAKCGTHVGVDNDKLSILKKIVNETGAGIVLSSPWSVDCDDKGAAVEDGFAYLKKRLSRHALRVLSMTEYDGKNGVGRGAAVKSWLDKNHDVAGAFVILDCVGTEELAEYCVDDIQNHLVNVDIKTGLSPEEVEKAIEILSE